MKKPLQSKRETYKSNAEDLLPTFTDVLELVMRNMDQNFKIHLHFLKLEICSITISFSGNCLPNYVCIFSFVSFDSFSHLAHDWKEEIVLQCKQINLMSTPATPLLRYTQKPHLLTHNALLSWIQYLFEKLFCQLCCPILINPLFLT